MGIIIDGIARFMFLPYILSQQGKLYRVVVRHIHTYQ